MERPMSQGKKRPRDANQLAKSIADLATGAVTEPAEPDASATSASARGRKGGIKGGKSRSASLTPEQRKDIAKLAAEARWRARKR